MNEIINEPQIKIPGIAMRQILQQATIALSVMDADRLEELVLACSDLQREISSVRVADSNGAPRSPEKIPGVNTVEHKPVLKTADLDLGSAEFDLLGSMLFETRANLKILSQVYQRGFCGYRSADHPGRH